MITVPDLHLNPTNPSANKNSLKRHGAGVPASVEVNLSLVDGIYQSIKTNFESTAIARHNIKESAFDVFTMEAVNVKAQQSRGDLHEAYKKRDYLSWSKGKETHPKAVKENEECVDAAHEYRTHRKQEETKKLKAVDGNDPLTFSLKRKRQEDSSSSCGHNMPKSGDFCLHGPKKVRDSEDCDLIARWRNHSAKLESKLNTLKDRERKYHDQRKKSSRAQHEDSERFHQKSLANTRPEKLKSSQTGWKELNNKHSNKIWEITETGRRSPDSEFSILHSVGYQMTLLKKDSWTISSISQNRDPENGTEMSKSNHSNCQGVTDEVEREKELKSNRSLVEPTSEPATTSSRTPQPQKHVPGKGYAREFLESPNCLKQMSSYGSTDSLMNPDNIEVYSQDENEGDDHTKVSLWSTRAKFSKDLSEPRPLRQPRSKCTVTNEHQVSQCDRSSEGSKFIVAEEGIENQKGSWAHGLEKTPNQGMSVSPHNFDTLAKSEGKSMYKFENERKTKSERDTSRSDDRIQQSAEMVINRSNSDITPVKSRNLYQEDANLLSRTQFSLNDVYTVQNYSASVGNREIDDIVCVKTDYSQSCPTPVKDEINSEDYGTTDFPVLDSQRTPVACSNQLSTSDSPVNFGSAISLVPTCVQKKYGGSFSLGTFKKRMNPVKSLLESPKKTEANTKAYDCKVSPVSSKNCFKSEWPRASHVDDKKYRRSLPSESLSWRKDQSNFKPTWPTHFSKRSRYSVEVFKNKTFEVGFIDTHCHLDFLFRRLQFDKSFTYFKDNCKGDDTFPPSFEGCIAVFCEARTFHKISWWTDFLKVPGVWAAFGCHPHFADQYDEEAEQYLRIALSQKKAVALGEIGLDYSSKNSQSKLLQRRVFKKQLKIALEMKKPLVIHCRDANEDCLKIMKKKVPSDYLIHRHCFTGDWEEASLWLESFSNVYLGFTPLITSNNHRAVNLRDVASKMPLNRLLLETDAPYFRPNCLSSSLKGSSHPGMAIHVAAQVAVLRNLDLEEVLVQVRKNTHNMYNI